MTKKVNIFGRLHAQTEEGILTTANEIFDETLSKTQAEINSESSGSYHKPSSGIPKSDLSNDVQESLSKADSALQEHQDISNYPDSAEWDGTNKNIVFKHNGVVLSQMTISGANFIKDGMVDNIVIENGNLVITFNTDSGKQPISIPISDIFNADNYYTKTQINSKFDNKVDKSIIMMNEGNSYNSSSEAETEAATSNWAGDPKKSIFMYWYNGSSRGIGSGLIKQNITLTSSNKYECYQTLYLSTNIYKRIISLGSYNSETRLFTITLVGNWANKGTFGSYNDLIDKPIIPDVSQFITKSVDDLVNYYLKNETYTKSEVQTLIGAINQFHYEVYTTISEVSEPQSNVLYLIGPTGSGSDKYEEYVYPNSTIGWVKIGDTSIDLSGYVTTTALNNALANYTLSADIPVEKGTGTNSVQQKGTGAVASGTGSHAEGTGTTASGFSSHAEGGYFDIIEGELYYGGSAIGMGSHAEGTNTTASGTGSHAEGLRTTASGYYSHAEGESTQTSGNYSHAEGGATLTNNTYEHAEGHYNKSNKVSDTYGNVGNTQHSVGIGTSTNDRKNAHEIMQNGDHYIYGIGGYNGTNAAATGIKTLQQVINEGASGSPMIEITWSALKSLRDNSQLLPGKQYRITDYQCTTTQGNTQSAGHQFDIIVVADGVNKLNENARACLHSGDTYFANNKLEAWQLKYSLDNDTDRFSWADETNGKGIIYWMKDEFNNECPYDFKNIQLMPGNKTNAGTVADVFYYTFCYFVTTSDIQDHSLNNNGFIKCYNNKISSYISSNTAIIPFIVFRNIIPANECHSNTFGSNCYNNIFGHGCYNNIFGNGCHDNIFGQGNKNNIFGNDCVQNNFAITCINNILGNNCSDNILGEITNDFGDNCSFNIFGNQCSYNTLRGRCSYNTFGNSFLNNVLGIYCSYNIFGNGCRNNNIASSNYYNTFGNSCIYITTEKSYTENIIIENYNKYIIITSSQSPTSTNTLRNFKIGQGVNNTTSTKTISHNTLNDIFQTIYKPSNSKEIEV